MTLLSTCLSSNEEALLGKVPVLQEGPSGHRQLAEYFFRLCSSLKPSVFCDVGANQGESGRIVLSRCKGCRVYGFEANPITYEKYRAINEAAGVKWMNLAVCDRAGEIALRIPKTLARALVNGRLVDKVIHEAEDTARASLLFRDEDAATKEVYVPAITLDAFFKDEPILESDTVALWIDVEGAASMVFEGSKGILPHTRLVMVEVEGFPFWRGQKRVGEVVNLLSQFNLTPVLRDREYGDAQFNLIFLSTALIESPIVRKFLQHSCHDNEAQITRNVQSGERPSPGNVPVLVPCFNNPTYCDSMYRQLVRLGFENITFIDNNSSTDEMHAWLEDVSKDGVQVERLSSNLGPRRSVFSEDRLRMLRRWFCVTDPDLAFNTFLPDSFLEIMEESLVKWSSGKAGFALDISRIDHLKPKSFKIGNHYFAISEWEERFWRNRLGFTPSGDAVYKAQVDTTFALYDLHKFRVQNFLDAIRIAGRFTAIHKPWMINDDLSERERTAYQSSQRHSYYL